MAHKTLIGGTAYEVSGGKTLIDGTGYNIAGGRTLIGGTGYDISFQNGLALSDIAVGTIVYIQEGSTWVPFYVAKHNYESGLNGNGRTLLVRQKCIISKRWGSYMGWYECSAEVTGTPYYLANTYKATLPNAIQSMLSAKTWVTDTNRDSTMSCAVTVFTPSLAEYGLTYSDTSVDGSALPIASTLRVAYYNSTKVDHWTRTGRVYEGDDGETDQGFVSKSGTAGVIDSNSSIYVRPCFTLPATTLFDPATMRFLSAA